MKRTLPLSIGRWPEEGRIRATQGRLRDAAGNGETLGSAGSQQMEGGYDSTGQDHLASHLKTKPRQH
jgi:hypothetical protein